MFYKIANHASQAATPVDKPWELTVAPAPDFGKDKKLFKAWCGELSTNHVFLSGYEGMTPGVRVSYDQGNVPFKVHALFADYDAPVAPDAFTRLTEQPVSEFKPAYGQFTWSGYGRLIWILEAPLLIANKSQLKEFLTIVSKQLKLNAWLAGYDGKAFSDPSKYYESGKPWIPMTPAAVIPTAFLQMWLLEASKKATMSDKLDDFHIPMDKLAAEVESRFPGRWQGPFEEGMRGIRFWDITASDPTGAVILADGMMAFSGEQAFIPWRQIFGNMFVDQFKADKIAGIRDLIAYDGQKYWMNMEDQGWTDLTETVLSRKLRCKQFSGKPARGSTCSEIDLAMDDFATNCRVHRALPFILFPPGIISHKGKKVLNIATAKCMVPNRNLETVADAVAQCPWIWSFLKALLVDETLEDSNIQLNVFLNWLQKFYVSRPCLCLDPPMWVRPC